MGSAHVYTQNSQPDVTQLAFEAESQLSDVLSDVQTKVDQVYKRLEQAETDGDCSAKTADSINSELYHLQEKLSTAIVTHKERVDYLKERVPDRTLESMVQGDELIKLQLRKLELGQEKINNIVRRLQVSHNLDVYTLDTVCQNYVPGNSGMMHG